MSDDLPFPKSPDPLVMAQLGSLGRALLAALAGAGLLGGVWASVSAEQIANLLTAILTIGGAAMAAWTGFGAWRKNIAEAKAKRSAEVAAAVASAEATVEAGRATPVTVTVTPQGQPNEAVRIAPAEQALAPSVPGGVSPSPAPKPAT